MKVFVSYAQEDAQRLAAITQALTTWQATYWLPPRSETSATQNTQIQQALTQTDVFLRICTTATPRSYWMTFEQTAFLSMQAEEYRQSRQIKRKLINLVLDKNYQREPFDYADPIVEAVDLDDVAWQSALHAALFNSVVA